MDMKKIREFMFSFKGIAVIAATGFVFGYLTTAFDLIPDSIPFVGYMDDVLMVLLLLYVFISMFSYGADKKR
jgi:uncharacterized membrane protein YkvA (DUF1232 family)